MLTKKLSFYLETNSIKHTLLAFMGERNTFPDAAEPLRQKKWKREHRGWDSIAKHAKTNLQFLSSNRSEYAGIEVSTHLVAEAVREIREVINAIPEKVDYETKLRLVEQMYRMLWVSRSSCLKILEESDEADQLVFDPLPEDDEMDREFEDTEYDYASYVRDHLDTH